VGHRSEQQTASWCCGYYLFAADWANFVDVVAVFLVPSAKNYSRVGKINHR